MQVDWVLFGVSVGFVVWGVSVDWMVKGVKWIVWLRVF